MKELNELCSRYGVKAYDAQEWSMAPPGYLLSNPIQPFRWLGYITLSESTDPDLVESKIVGWLIESGFTQ